MRVYEYKEYTLDVSGNYHYTSRSSNLPLIITETTSTAPVVGNSYWTQIGTDIAGEKNSDRSGSTISLSSDGTIVAIGASLNDDGGSSAGHVRVYKYNDISWVQLGDDLSLIHI